MIVLGIILIVVGAVVAYIATDRAINIIGIVLAAVGLVLVLLGALDAGDVNLHESVIHARSSWSTPSA